MWLRQGWALVVLVPAHGAGYAQLGAVRASQDHPRVVALSGVDLWGNSALAGVALVAVAAVFVLKINHEERRLTRARALAVGVEPPRRVLDIAVGLGGWGVRLLLGAGERTGLDPGARQRGDCFVQWDPFLLDADGRVVVGGGERVVSVAFGPGQVR